VHKRLESSPTERHLWVLVGSRLNESAVCPGSQKGEPYPGVLRAQHCQQGEGRGCPALLCTVKPHLQHSREGAGGQNV